MITTYNRTGILLLFSIILLAACSEGEKETYPEDNPALEIESESVEHT
ncbi:hypothetical protein [Alteribacillus iranensis]|uniref:Uncharacterized protein n=1 Tax=Alteribacillus iranensis TaxID=930128 RepID=A0A1I2F189_9BACI|nr:hypothetical protein [Alteribacillus iranensis]SFE99154.1 hypothetical protein SAMN05192532_10847 [Alteribacillus iranensis]